MGWVRLGVDRRHVRSGGDSVKLGEYAELGPNTAHATVELLLPTRSDLVGALRVIDEFDGQSMREICRVIVSVSDPKAWSNFDQALRGREGVVLLPAVGDLTLYGNFRRLVMSSSADWISICADDDSIPQTFASLTAEPMPANTCLIVPPIELRTYDRSTGYFGELLKRFDPMSAPKRQIDLARETWPTWVFGLWRGDWLRAAYPPHDFDWLDCALLHKAIMSNSVRWVCDVEPLVCGFDPHRDPWAVNSTGLSTREWKNYCQDFLRERPLITRLMWHLRVERIFDSIAKRSKSM